MTDEPNRLGGLQPHDECYEGFIQALCWTVGADGQNGLHFNEPDELTVWDPELAHRIPFDRRRFLELFADFDDESPIMLMKLLPGPSWVLFSTESDDCPDYDELDAEGLSYAYNWLDKLYLQHDEQTKGNET